MGDGPSKLSATIEMASTADDHSKRRGRQPHHQQPNAFRI